MTPTADVATRPPPPAPPEPPGAGLSTFGTRCTSGPTAIVLAAASWSTVGPVMAFLPAGASPPAVAAARMAVGGALFTLLVGGRTMLRDLRAVRHGTVLAVTATVAMAGYQASYFTAMHLSGVAIGSVVSMTSLPLFSGLLAALVRRRRPSRVWVLATGTALTASVLLAGTVDGRGMNGPGVLCGLAAGFAYAVFTMVSHVAIGRGCPSRSMMAVSFVGAGALMSPLIVPAAGWLATGAGVAVVGYLAAVVTVGAYVLFGRGLEGTPATTAATLVLVEPAFAALIGLAVLREPVTARTVLGLAAMAAALTLFTVRTGRRRRGRHARG